LVDGWVEYYQLKEDQAKDFTAEVGKNRYRVHLFHASIGWVAALRLLPAEILTFSELGIKEEDVLGVSKGTGLTLFCGATGAGKSTTMNAVINSLLISDELGVTIIIEDPIEYLHNQETIFQREVGVNVKSFKDGLIEAVRSTPATIVIGEIRDSGTALEALKAGLSGHRVFATLHASSAKEALSRLRAFLDDSSSDLFIQSLQGVFAQHLINLPNGKKYCIYEALKIDKKARNIISQALDPKSQLTFNACNFDQKGETLIKQKEALISRGVSREALNYVEE